MFHGMPVHRAVVPPHGLSRPVARTNHRACRPRRARPGVPVACEGSGCRSATLTTAVRSASSTGRRADRRRSCAPLDGHVFVTHHFGHRPTTASPPPRTSEDYDLPPRDRDPQSGVPGPAIPVHGRPPRSRETARSGCPLRHAGLEPAAPPRRRTPAQPGSRVIGATGPAEAADRAARSSSNDHDERRSHGTPAIDPSCRGVRSFVNHPKTGRSRFVERKRRRATRDPRVSPRPVRTCAADGLAPVAGWCPSAADGM